jgi:hypothetical protein
MWLCCAVEQLIKTTTGGFRESVKIFTLLAKSNKHLHLFSKHKLSRKKLNPVSAYKQNTD